MLYSVVARRQSAPPDRGMFDFISAPMPIWLMAAEGDPLHDVASALVLTDTGPCGSGTIRSGRARAAQDASGAGLHFSRGCMPNLDDQAGSSREQDLGGKSRFDHAARSG